MIALVPHQQVLLVVNRGHDAASAPHVRVVPSLVQYTDPSAYEDVGGGWVFLRIQAFGNNTHRALWNDDDQGCRTCYEQLEEVGRDLDYDNPSLTCADRGIENDALVGVGEGSSEMTMMKLADLRV